MDSIPNLTVPAIVKFVYAILPYMVEPINVTFCPG